MRRGSAYWLALSGVAGGLATASAAAQDAPVDTAPDDPPASSLSCPSVLVEASVANDAPEQWTAPDTLTPVKLDRVSVFRGALGDDSEPIGAGELWPASPDIVQRWRFKAEDFVSTPAPAPEPATPSKADDEDAGATEDLVADDAPSEDTSAMAADDAGDAELALEEPSDTPPEDADATADAVPVTYWVRCEYRRANVTVMAELDPATRVCSLTTPSPPVRVSSKPATFECL